MTLRELEAWLALEIVGVYHARVHRSLCAPPNAVWAAGTAAAPPRTPTDPRRFLMDFLLAERRLLQRDGLHLFKHPILVGRAPAAYGAGRQGDCQIRSPRSLAGLRES